jgi:hypothetical protein
MTFDKLLNAILNSPDLAEFSFGGNCFSMAYALKTLIPESSIVISQNKRLFKESKRHVGHCGIKFNNTILDGEGIITEDDFLSWGMLDEHDLSYIENTSITKDEWKTEAYESEIIKMSISDMEDLIDPRTVQIIQDIINDYINEDYAKLADLLSDHLYMTNKLDFDFLSKFNEFLYEGEGYRLLVLKTSKSKVKDLIHQSFSKDLLGIKEFIENYKKDDKDALLKGTKRLFKSKIKGFDVGKALKFLSDNKLGITQKTYENWENENEVLSFEVFQTEELDLSVIQN